MIEIDASTQTAKEHLARLDAELSDLRQAHSEEIIRERHRHEAALRDIDERFYYQRQPIEKTREALLRVLVDVESMKAPQPRLIAETD
jgi:hypothetical protein